MLTFKGLLVCERQRECETESECEQRELKFLIPSSMEYYCHSHRKDK